MPKKIASLEFMKALRDGRDTDRLDVVKKYCEATDLDHRHLSLGYMSKAVCIIPSAPYLEDEDGNPDLILRKTRKNPDDRFPLDAGINTTHGGWTKKRISARMKEDKDGGRLIVLDFDGTKEDKENGIKHLKPLIKLVNLIAAGLTKRGLPPCVKEITTMDPNDPKRAKMHLTFKARKGDGSCTQKDHERRYDLLQTSVHEIVDQMAAKNQVPVKELNALRLDDSMRQISRLKRLAGHAKEGKQNAVEIIYTDKDAFVDWTRVLETKTQKIDLGPHAQISFGRRMRKSVWQKESVKGGGDKILKGVENASKSFDIAHHVYPLEVTKDRDSGQRGVRMRLEDDMGRTHYDTISLSAFADPSTRTEELKRLSHISMIRPGKALDFVQALDHWRQSKLSKKEVTSTERQGWQEKRDGSLVYINGKKCYGEDWVVDGEGSEKRSKKRGTLESWKKGISELVSPDNHGLILALGQALAGVLVKPCVKDSFFLHLHGSSGIGKTTALKIASSVWGDPTLGEFTQTWRTTSNRLEMTASAHSGALLPLDELKELGKNSKTKEILRAVIMMISGGKGKSRMTSAITARNTFQWSLAALSTGETSTGDWLGDLQQGGESVRAIDVPVERGDLATSAEHADEIIRWSSQNYGVAGEAFAEKVIPNIDNTIDIYNNLERDMRSHTDEPELGRVISSLALTTTALCAAVYFDILPDTITEKDVKTTTFWAIERIKKSRGEINSPENRALQMLRDKMASSPALFPTESRYDKAFNRVIAIKQKDASKGFGDMSATTGKIYTCESMLKESGVCSKAGVGTRRFLSWLEEQGLSTPPSGQTRVGGVKKSWHLIDIEEEDETEDSENDFIKSFDS